MNYYFGSYQKPDGSNIQFTVSDYLVNIYSEKEMLLIVLTIFSDQSRK